MARFCISLACDLVEDVPQQVVDVLSRMVGLASVELASLPPHRYFKYKSWGTLLSQTGLPWFPGEGVAALRKVGRYYRPMSEGGAEVSFYTFSFRCEDTDDGISSFIEFMDWLAAYSRTQGFVGYWQSEYSEHPTLVYFQNGVLAFAEPQLPPKFADGSSG